MKKLYSVFELYVVKVNRGNNTNQYFICTKDKFREEYIEIFTKTKIKVDNKLNIEDLSNYYSLLSICDFKTKKPLMLTEKELLYKYNEINYVNTLKEHNDEKIKEELEKRGIFEESLVYKKRLSKVFN